MIRDSNGGQPPDPFDGLRAGSDPLPSGGEGRTEEGGRVYFIGAGPGDPELLTLRGKRLIESADLVLYADSLVSPEIIAFARNDAVIIGSASETLESIVQTMVTACRAGQTVARVHSGDPSIYGALNEQLAALEREGVPYSIVPGVSSAFAAAAELQAELTVPEVTQTVIFTRQPSRTVGVPAERLRDLAAHGATMAIFLSVTSIERVVDELRAGGYSLETPAVVVYRATWPDQLLLRGSLGEVAGLARRAGLKRQALIMVGAALDPAIRQLGQNHRSRLYAAGHNHIFRPSSDHKPARLSGDRMQPDRLALIAASGDGARLAVRLGRVWPDAERHVVERYVADGGPGAHPIKPPLSASVPRFFSRYQRLVFFLPVGAVVRLVAPHLRDKRSDPAVVAVDDGGRFAISVLSGHAGGANVLAEQVGAALGLQPVVTTAVERRGLTPPELIGLPFGWKLESSREALLRASAAMANGHPVAVYAETREASWLRRDIPVRHFRSLAALARSELDGAIVVSDRDVPESVAARSVVWRPRELVAGVGCIRGADAGHLEALLRAALAKGGLAAGGLRLLATLDRKLSEPGVVDLAARLGLPLRGYSAAELDGVPVPNPSDVVRRAVGTASVAEAAAELASEGGELVVTKRSSAQGSVAIARLSGAG